MADNSWIDALLGNKTTAQIGSLLSADQVGEGSVSNAYSRTAAAIPGKTDKGSKYWFAKNAEGATTAETESTTSDSTSTDDSVWLPTSSGDSQGSSSGGYSSSKSQASSAKESTPGVSVADVQGGPPLGGMNTGTLARGAGLLGSLAGYSNVGDVAQTALDVATNSPDTYSNVGKALVGAAGQAIAGSNPLTSLGTGLVKELAFEEDPDMGKPAVGFGGAYGGAMLGASLGPIGSILGAMLGGGVATGSYLNGALGDAINTRTNEELRDYLEDDNKMSYKESAAIAASADRSDKNNPKDNSGATGPTGSSTGKDSKGRNKGDSYSGGEPVSQRGYTTLGDMMGKAFGGKSSGDGSGNNVGGEKGSSTGTGGGYNGGNYSGDKGSVSGL